MRALRLDYQRNNKPTPWLGLVVLGVALAALALMSHYYQTLNQQLAVWEGKLDRIERLSSHAALGRRLPGEQTTPAEMIEVKEANQVVRQLNLPWNALFNAVEVSGGQSIALLSMEPDLQKGTVKISGEAKDLDALLNYVRQLSKHGVFGRVLLQSHHILQDVAEKPLRFSLLADWKGGAP